MKKARIFLCLLLLLFSGKFFAQTVLWSENFDSSPAWSLSGNGTTFISGSTPTPGGTPNVWNINNVGQTIDGTANLHITCTGFICNILGAPGPVYNASSAANNTNTVASANNDIPAAIFSGAGPFNLTFQWSCDGAAAPNNGSGRLIYSTNSGATWTEWPTNYNGNAAVNNESIDVSLLTGFVAGVTPLRLGFRWFNQGTAGHQDPPMIVDNLQIVTPTAPTNSITTGAITGSVFCAGDNITIPFTSTGTFTAGNVYTAQLSNAAGSFAAPVVLGTFNSTANSGSISGTIPPGTPSGAGYMIRVISSNPNITGTSVGPITINAQVAAGVTISSLPVGAICAGTNVVFSSNISNGGTTPTYQWQVNGVNVPGATLSTFSSSSLANNDLVTVILTSNAACVTNSPVTSAAYTAVVNPVVPVSVSITASPNAAICAGDNVTFTANPVNGGTTPGYQWTLNGVNIPGATLATYSTSTLANGDQIAVILTSSNTCVSGNPATSNIITQTVNPAAPVSVALSVSPSGPVCAGTNLTFTASPVNGGTSPVYTWTVNGIVQSGVTGSSFSSAGLNDGDVVMVEISSNEPCATGSPATSNSIVVQVQSNIVASVVISADVNPVCSGGTVNFSSVLVGAGSSPVFQWSINGTPVSGANDSIFSSSTLSDGDVVMLNMISSSGCVSNPNVNSQNLTITVVNSVSTSIVLSVSQDTICSGVTPVFSSVITGGGSTPSVDWFVDGVLVTTNQGASFNPGLMTNGQMVNAVLQSSALCAFPLPAFSDTITITVLPDIAPEVLLTVDFDTLCSGTPFNFTAIPLVAGGPNPTYTWYVNGVAVPGNISPNYSAILNDGDQVQVELFSNDPCADPTNDLSNIITVSVTNLSLTPSVSITANNLVVCSGVPVQFTALPVNGGSSPDFQWQVNGVNLPADTNLVFTSSTLNNGDVVTLVMTSNSPCVSTGPVVSNSLTLTVNPSVNPTVAVNSTGNILCAGQSVTFNAVVSGQGSAPVYQWLLNGNPISGATGLSYTTTPNNGDNFTFQLISSDVCDTAGVPVLSSPQIILVQPNITPTAVITVSDSSFCINQIPTFVAQITGGGLNPAYIWYVNGVQAISGSPNFATNNLQDGDVISFVMTSSSQCATPSSVTSNSISVDIYPLPLVELGNDVTIQLGQSVNLSASTVLTNTYSWSPVTALDCGNCASVVATPEESTMYKVFVTDPSTGCSNQDSVKINVETQEVIFLPSGFSPNNDGSNDVLFLRGIGIDNFLFELYDRFGALVFSTTDLKQGWDGTVNGKNANPGSYTYVLSGQFRSGTEISQKGTTTLVR